MEPRLGVAWYLPRLGLVLRSSYERIFGTPAAENLLLSTSVQAVTLNQMVTQLPVRPSRGNYYEVGTAKRLLHSGSWSANYFWRDIRNFGDDDTLLNTGISFAIALRSASIYGFESHITVSQYGPLSGLVNYSYIVAKAQLPVLGGLFLGEDAGALLSSRSRIWSRRISVTRLMA